MVLKEHCERKLHILCKGHNIDVTLSQDENRTRVLRAWREKLKVASRFLAALPTL